MCVISYFSHCNKQIPGKKVLKAAGFILAHKFYNLVLCKLDISKSKFIGRNHN